MGNKLGRLGAQRAGYAFGAPILFQYCNVIYLVGAAWLPLGMHAVDRWVRLGRRLGICGAGVVWRCRCWGATPGRLSAGAGGGRLCRRAGLESARRNEASALHEARRRSAGIGWLWLVIGMVAGRLAGPPRQS